MARGRLYELTAKFSAENNASAEFSAIESRIDALDRKMRKLDKSDATLEVTLVGDDKVIAGSGKIDKAVNKATRSRTVDVDLAQKQFDKKYKEIERKTEAIDNLTAEASAGVDISKGVRTLKQFEGNLRKYERNAWEAALAVNTKQAYKDTFALTKTINNVWGKVYEARLNLDNKQAMAMAAQSSAAMDEFEKRRVAELQAKKASDFNATIADVIKSSKMINVQRTRLMIGAHDEQARRTLMTWESQLKAYESKVWKAALAVGTAEAMKDAHKAVTFVGERWAKIHEAKLTVENNMAVATLMSTEKMKDDMKEAVEFSVRVKKEGEFFATLGRIDRAAAALVDEPRDIPIGMSTTDFNRELARIRRQLDTQIEKTSTIEVRAREYGLDDIAAKARATRAQLNAIRDTKVNVESNGFARLMLQAGAAYKTMDNLDGTYRVDLDMSSVQRSQAVALAAKQGFDGLLRTISTAPPLIQTFAQSVYGTQQILYVFSNVIMALGIAALPALAAGLVIAIASLAAFAGGIGLIVAAAAPMISALAGSKQKTEELATAQNGARNAADALASAQDGLANAQQGVADAQRSGSEQIRSAIQSHEDALYQVERAQEAVGDANAGVTDAIRDRERAVADAVRGHADALEGLDEANDEVRQSTQSYNDELAEEKYRIQDLQYEMAGFALDQRELALDIADAREELANAGSGEERERAQIQLERLLLREKQLTDDTRESRENLTDAQRNGTDELQSARASMEDAYKGQRDAVRSVADAERAIQDARVQGNEAVADAQDAVADAQRSLVDSQREAARTEQAIGQARQDAARGVADAQKQVAAAQRQLINAQKDYNEANRKVAALQKAMPSQYAAIQKQLTMLKGAYRTAFAPATAIVARMTSKTLDLATNAMPLLGSTAESTALGMEQAFSNIGANFGNFGVFKSIRTILASMPSITRNWTEAIGNFGGAFTNVMAIAMPFAESMSRAVNRTSKSFLEWTNSEAGRAKITKFFQSAAPIAETLWKWIRRAAGALTNLVMNDPQAVVNGINMVGNAIVRMVVFIRNVVRWWRNLDNTMAGGFLKQAIVLFAKLFVVAWALRLPIKAAVAGFKALKWAINSLKLITGIKNAQMLGQAIGYRLAQALSWAGKAARGVGNAFSWLWKNAAQPAIRMLGNGLVWLRGQIARLSLKGIVQAFTRLPGIVAAPLGAIGALLGFTGAAAVGMGAAVVTAAVVAVGAIVRIIGAVANNFRWLSNIWTGLGAMIQNGSISWGHAIWSFARSLVAALAHTIVTGMITPVQMVFGMLGKIPGKAGETFRNWNAKIDEGLETGRSLIAGKTANMANTMGANLNRGANEAGAATGRMKNKTGYDMNSMSTIVAQQSNKARNAGTVNFNNLANQTGQSNNRMKNNTNQSFDQMLRDISNSTRSGRNAGTNNFESLMRGGSASNNQLQRAVTREMSLADRNLQQSTTASKTQGTRAMTDLQRSGESAMTQAHYSWRDQAWMASSSIQESLNATLKGMASFIEEAGVDIQKPSTFPIVRSGSVSSASLGGNNGAPAQMRRAAGGIDTYGRNSHTYMARGGVQAPTGGISNGTTRVYGEVPGTKEFYITDNAKYRQRNLDILNQANEHMGNKSAVASNKLSRPSSRDDCGHAVAMEDIRMNKNVKPKEYTRGGENFINYAVGGKGAMNDAVQAKFGPVEVRDFHASYLTGSGAYNSLDFMVAPDGTRATGSGKQLGDDIAAFVAPPSAAKVIWYGMSNWGGGWQPYSTGPGMGNANTLGHYDHVHAEAHPDQFRGAQGTFTGGSSGGFSGPDYGAMWDSNVKKPAKIDSKFGLINKTGDAIITKLYNKAKEETLAKMPVSTGANGVTGNFSGSKQEMALTFAKNAVSRGMPGRLPVMTSMQELGGYWFGSGDDYKSVTGYSQAADHDSLGFFQQRPSTGWGTPEQIMDPAYALDKFLDAAEGFKGQYSNDAMGLSGWAQAVQRSAFPDAYAQHWDAAGKAIGDPKYFSRGGAMGYTHGGLARQPHLGLLGEGGGKGEVMWPLDDVRTTRAIAKAVNMGTQTSQTHSQRVSTSNILSSSSVSSTQTSGDAAVLASEIQTMKDEIVNTLRQELQEIGLTEATVQSLVKFGASTAFAAMKSSKGGEVISEQMDGILDFDIKMKGLG